MPQPQRTFTSHGWSAVSTLNEQKEGRHINAVFSGSSQDYGMWERGDKTNQGITEINASSIGMAKVKAHTQKHTVSLVFPSSWARYWSEASSGEQVDGGENSSWVLSETEQVLQ